MLSENTKEGILCWGGTDSLVATWVLGTLGMTAVVAYEVK